MSDQPPSLPGMAPEATREAIRQVGKVLQETVRQLRGQPLFLFGIAVMLLALVSYVLSAFVPAIQQLVWFPYAFLVFSLILVGLSLFQTRHSASAQRSSSGIGQVPLHLVVRVHEENDQTRGIPGAMVSDG